jgi:hypothetical protein
VPDALARSLFSASQGILNYLPLEMPRAEIRSKVTQTAALCPIRMHIIYTFTKLFKPNFANAERVLSKSLPIWCPAAVRRRMWWLLWSFYFNGPLPR